MAHIMNLRMKSKKLITSFGMMEFDEHGIAELPDDRLESFLQMKGFERAPKAQDEPNEPEEDDLEKLNVLQLKKYAKERGIDLNGANKRDEIIQAILADKKH